jgi:muramoyltetrapeptide carboxypeptidase
LWQPKFDCNLGWQPLPNRFQRPYVLIEEVNEAPYRIDRMFSQLRLSGALSKAKGIVLGHFTDCKDTTPTSRTVDMLCQEYFGSLGIPVLSHFATGHDFPFINCPIGLRVKLDANRQTLTIMEELYENN